MNKLFEGVEHQIDKAVPYVIIALTVLLILEFAIDLSAYEFWVSFADSFIIAFFILELAFKWNRTRNVIKFLKLHWLEVLAVFPFYLIFRAYVEVLEILRLEEAQKLAHEAILFREARLAREAELFAREAKLAEVTRTGSRVVRGIQRGIRLFTGAHIQLEKKR